MPEIKGSLSDLKRLQKQASERLEHQKQQTREQTRQTAIKFNKVEPLNEDDKKLFQQAVKWVQPLPNANRVEHQAKPKGTREVLLAKRAKASGEETTVLLKKAKHPTVQKTQPVYNEDLSHYVHHEHSVDLMKKLSKGFWQVQATLDLHGCTESQAAERFDRFLGSCLEFNVQCICIIHGKGLGSKDSQAVLKTNVRRWLMHNASVMAFVEAPEALGGSGAVVILLKTK